ncbi:MAG: dihydrofolate reductase [Parasporobacterium sp.]|nr:dihydrofolate reductase [Parasporobacterium sp.]
MLSMLVTVDRNWAISNAHKPLISIPDDVKFVRDATYGQVIIAGKHTFEYSFNSRPLPNRTMIVISKDPAYNVPGVITVQDTEEALKKAESFGTDIFVLGGRRLYEAYMPLCNEIHVTAVDYEYTADSYFPDLDKMPEWVLADESEEQTHFDVVYYFRRYIRRIDYKSLG